MDLTNSIINCAVVPDSATSAFCLILLMTDTRARPTERQMGA